MSILWSGHSKEEIKQKINENLNKMDELDYERGVVNDRLYSLMRALWVKEGGVLPIVSGDLAWLNFKAKILEEFKT